MEFQSEVIHGFYSIFVFKCKVCCIESKLYSENIQQNQYMLVNKAVVNACQSIGKYVLYILIKNTILLFLVVIIMIICT